MHNVGYHVICGHKDVYMILGQNMCNCKELPESSQRAHRELPESSQRAPRELPELLETSNPQ